MYRLLIVFIPLLVVGIPLHRFPIATFYQEWLSVVGLLLASLVGTTKSSVGGTIEFHPLALCAIGLAIWSVLRGAFGVPGSPSSGLYYAAYLTVFVMAYCGGKFVRNKGGETLKVWVPFAFCLVGLLNVLLGALQLTFVSVPFDLLLDRGQFLYGNLWHPNHFNQTLWIAISSVLYLFFIGQIQSSVAWMSVLLMMTAAAFTGSRAAIVYAFVVTAAPVFLRKELRSRRLWLQLLVFPTYLGLYGILSAGALSWFAVPTYADRLATEAAAATAPSGHQMPAYVRLADWKAAARHVSVSGVGPGLFYATMFRSPASWREEGLVLPIENAHNLFMQTAVELGWPASLVVLGVLIMWLVGCFRTKCQFIELWGVCVGLTLLFYSQIEYPFWYLYFVIPFGLVAGMTDHLSSRYCVEFFCPRFLTKLVLVVGLLFCGWWYRDNLIVEDAFMVFREAIISSPEVEKKVAHELDRIAPYSPAAPYAALVRATSAWTGLVRSGAILESCPFAMQHPLHYAVFPNCAAALTASGKQKEGEALLRVSCDAIPKSRGFFVRRYRTMLPPDFPKDVPSICTQVEPTFSG